MTTTSILRKPTNSGIACVIKACTASNSATLRPLGQMVRQLDQNSKNMSLSMAIAQRYIDAELEVEYPNGVTESIKFREAMIDMARGREPKVVFQTAPMTETNITLSVQFTDTTHDEWVQVRQGAGCAWCIDANACTVCKLKSKSAAATC